MNRRYTSTRGLAASAVAALAITGLTAAPSYAAPDAELLSIFNPSRYASVRVDSDWTFPATFANTSVTLTGEAQDEGDTMVAFEYNPDPAAGPSTGGWVAIPGTSYANEIATTDWTPDSALVGTSVAVRLVASDLDGTSYVIRNNVAIVGGTDVHSVRLNAGAGFFTQPYAGSGRTATLASVGGTTSATSGAVELSWWRSATGAFEGQTDAAVTETELKVEPSPTSVAGGAFQGALDITAFGAADGDVIALAAERDSDDVRPVALYAQTITGITGAAPSVSASTGADVPITVTDHTGQPVAGAEVRRNSDGSLVGYTDAAGTVVARQPAGTTEKYYANTTDGDAYEPGAPAMDVLSSDVVAPAFVPVATSTTPVLADGAAFDDDEYAAGDIVLQVLDQEGSPFGAGASVDYALYPTSGSAPAPTTGTTDAAGQVAVPFNPAGPNGSYTLSYATPAGAPTPSTDMTTFVAGDATLRLIPTAGTAPSGGQITYAGSLKVGNVALPGRAVDLSYLRGAERAPGSAADARLVGTSTPLAGRVTTGADGSFIVRVKDAPEPGRPVETGQLTAATAAVVAGGGSTLAGNPAETATATARFDQIKAKLRLLGTGNGKKNDVLRVSGPSSIAGEKVVLQRKQGKKWVRVAGRTLSSTGDVKVTVRDRNGALVTRYRVTLVASNRVKGTTSNVHGVR